MANLRLSVQVFLQNLRFKMSKRLTFLCLTCDFKGEDFFKSLKAEGHIVYLVTSKEHEHENWPHDAIDEIFYLDKQKNGHWNTEHLMGGIAHLMKNVQVDRVVALDDFDVQKAAEIREIYRIPGMGLTTANIFRDKLAMRMKAKEAGIRVPAFSALYNDAAINTFIENTPAPWVVKPRSEASATGIKKVHTAEELWNVINELGANRNECLVEQFLEGDVYHADSLIVDNKVKFCRTAKYLNTPFEVAHGGGIFRSATIPFGSKEDKDIQKMNAEIMKAFGMQYSASHTEFIQSKTDGRFYFLETSARVGGARIAEMMEASSGINLWTEWAKVEVAMVTGATYKLPKVSKTPAGILMSLCRNEYPDMSSFTEKEIYWTLNMKYHIGMIIKANKQERVMELLEQYAERVNNEFHASVPAKEAVLG